MESHQQKVIETPTKTRFINIKMEVKTSISQQLDYQKLIERLSKTHRKTQKNRMVKPFFFATIILSNYSV